MQKLSTHTHKREFRISDDDWLIVEEAAHRDGRTVSGWIRRQIMQAARRELCCDEPRPVETVRRAADR